MPQSILTAESAEGQLNLLKSGAFADFKITCQDHEFKVHRALICPTSTYFAKVCADGFGFIEGSDSKVNLSEDNPEIISRVLLFLYTRKYNAAEVPQIGTMTGGSSEAKSKSNDSNLTNPNITDGDTNMMNTPENEPVPVAQEKPAVFTTEKGIALNVEQAQYHLTVHAEVYACADRFGIEELKEYACTHFEDIANHHQLKVYGRPFFGDLLAFIYDNTMIEKAKTTQENKIGGATGLRYKATMSTLQNLNAVPAPAEIESIVKEHEPLAWEVAQALRESKKEALTYSILLTGVRFELRQAQDQLKQKNAEKLDFGKKVTTKLATYLANVKRCDGCSKKLEVSFFTLDNDATNQNKMTLGIVCRGCAHKGTVTVQT